LESARAIADRILADVEGAGSRFRSDSELVTIQSHLSDGVEVSPTLALLVRHALAAAELTDGDVDPTLGRALDALGYDRDIRLVHASDGDSDAIVRAIASPRPGWRRVSLKDRTLRVPAGMALDLGATAKAVAADLVADAVHRETGSGVLISLGGDIATAGRGPVEGWTVLVQDLDTDPAAIVRLDDGRALATSSTQRRTWRRGERDLHHILDPRTGEPADLVWRSVSVCATSCVVANALTTASIVRGEAAVPWLAQLGLPARLVRGDGRVVTLGGWPAESGVEREREQALV
jgi:thiamine biosynthesis lipoprotein